MLLYQSHLENLEAATGLQMLYTQHTRQTLLISMI